MARKPVDIGTAAGTSAAVLVLAVLGAAMVTAEILSGSMMPLMAIGLDTSEGMIGQAVTASALVAIITSLGIGTIAGGRDRRKILITLTGFLVVSNLGVALAPNVWVMLAARLILGAAIGIIWGLLPAIVLRLASREQFNRTFSQVVMGVSVAAVIVAPLSAWIGAIISWRVVYLGAAAVALAALMLLIFAFPPLPATPGAMDRDLRGTLRLPGLIAGMVGIMLIFGGAQAFIGYQVPFMEGVTGLGTSGVSITLLLTGISGVIGTLVASRLLGMSLPGVLVSTPGTMAILLAVLVYTGTATIPTIAILMLWLGARAIIGVAVNAWIAHTFPENLEGVGGILVAVIQGSMMLGAILGGVLIDNAGPRAPAVAGAIILAMGTVYCYRIMYPRASGHQPDEALVLPLLPPLTSTIVTNDEQV